ncbi:hypothetical protein ATO8_15473 [Roseivivax marinus]|uniref:50S ribosomal protein L35 n=1 Tax=Roseivivax marinus TaxID=1379903 RepID=W4HI31_9RHOB|nr:hypothetical protein [Roseivivax marinus]ETW11660.1 hypothetical protein ATO8_15473 [Roseivivax marinus]UMA65549.1 hypothetical protein LVO79_03545 [Roseivivax marinus]SEL44414.1 hypothetical protein SAMN05444413_10954 [Roseivivax marinus]
MPPDLALTIGLILAVFAIPSIVSAMSDGRAPRISALVVTISGGLLIYALRARPGGYVPAEIPDVMVRTISALLN